MVFNRRSAEVCQKFPAGLYEGTESSLNTGPEVREGAWHIWENADVLIGLAYDGGEMEKEGRRGLADRRQEGP